MTRTKSLVTATLLTLAAHACLIPQADAQGALFASIQARYGAPPGPLLAIWGMETGFGSQRGNQNMLASIATLAYDCRRSAYFTEHLYAALQLIDRGALSPAPPPSLRGAKRRSNPTCFSKAGLLRYARNDVCGPPFFMA